MVLAPPPRLVLALVAGIGSGLLFSAVGGTGWRAAVGGATAAGLLLADALRRIVDYRGELVAAVPAVLGLGLLALMARPMPVRDRARGLLLVVPATAVALALVSAPDLLEDLVFVRL